MSPKQVAALLSELCVDLGFCLPPDKQAHLQNEPPIEVDAFTDAIIRAEGLDPYADIPLKLRRDVRARVTKHFGLAEDDPAR
jgi:hypothetical protein